MVDDNSIWEFERSLWTGSAEHYRDSIADDCLMVIPKPPYVMSGVKAIEAVSDTPRWSKLDLDEQRIERVGDDIIVIAYKAEANRDGAEPYIAYCTSTYSRGAGGTWQVVQHQQTPPPVNKS